MGLQPTGSVALAVAVLMVLASCGGSSQPDRPSADTPSAVPGATTVYGTERLSWLQPGDVSDWEFLAYVDDAPVALDADVRMVDIGVRVFFSPSSDEQWRAQHRRGGVVQLVWARGPAVGVDHRAEAVGAQRGQRGLVPGCPRRREPIALRLGGDRPRRACLRHGCRRARAEGTGPARLDSGRPPARRRGGCSRARGSTRRARARRHRARCARAAAATTHRRAGVGGSPRFRAESFRLRLVSRPRPARPNVSAHRASPRGGGDAR